MVNVGTIIKKRTEMLENVNKNERKKNPDGKLVT